MVYMAWSLFLAIQIDVYLVVLICSSLMTNDIDLNPFKSIEICFMVQNIVCLSKCSMSTW